MARCSGVSRDVGLGLPRDHLTLLNVCTGFLLFHVVGVLVIIIITTATGTTTVRTSVSLSVFYVPVAYVVVVVCVCVYVLSNIFAVTTTRTARTDVVGTGAR